MTAPDEPLTAVPSPCVRVCCLDDDDICLGCYRALKEIVGWSAADDAEKTEILIRCRARYTAHYERLRLLTERR